MSPPANQTTESDTEYIIFPTLLAPGFSVGQREWKGHGGEIVVVLSHQRVSERSEGYVVLVLSHQRVSERSEGHVVIVLLILGCGRFL